jgi:hypothetical protein
LRSPFCLAALVLGAAVLLQHVGFATSIHRSFVDSLIYAAQACLSIQDKNVALRRTGDALLIVLMLGGPLFLGLALLSVRNRVKR